MRETVQQAESVWGPGGYEEGHKNSFLDHYSQMPDLPVYTSISNTVALVKHFLSTQQHPLLRARHFALMENSVPPSTKGSRVISQVELSPTQPSLRSQHRS